MIGFAFAAMAAQRDAWPALPVEQPTWAPRGWTLVEGGYRTVATTTAPDLWTRRRLGEAVVRYGFARRVELWAAFAGGTVERTFTSGYGLAAPSFGARFGLARGEAPARSADLALGVICPWETDTGLSVGTGGLWAAAEGRRQLGPFRLDGSLAARWEAPGTVGWAADRHLDPAEVATGGLGALLQVGPLAPGVRLEAAFVGGGRIGDVVTSGGWRVSLEATGVVQLSRGLAITGALGDALVDDAVLAPVDLVGPSAALGLRIAL
ncbi:MAG: hypothetical protein H6735_03350 [Alphaproteobacteria bacterium]|nr:hypothetical protein [Alphaproteobacteria bacterium]